MSARTSEAACVILPERFLIDPPNLGEVRRWQGRCEKAFSVECDASHPEPEILIPAVLLWQLLVFAEAGLRFPSLLAEGAAFRLATSLPQLAGVDL